MFEFEKYCLINKNKYYIWYKNIITERFRNPLPDGLYSEKHHIIPKCIAPNSKVIKLTGREHFIVHLLLSKFIKTEKFKKKLIFATWAMCNQNSCHQSREKINSHTYEIIKKKYSISISGSHHWMKDPVLRKKVSEKMSGKTLSQETKDKISLQNKGRKVTWGDKISKANKNKKRTKEMNLRQSKRIKKMYEENKMKNPVPRGSERERVNCEYCGEMIDIANLKRWHSKEYNCLERLHKRKCLPGKRGQVNSSKYKSKLTTCDICKKTYTKYYYEKVHKISCRHEAIDPNI